MVTKCFMVKVSRLGENDNSPMSTKEMLSGRYLNLYLIIRWTRIMHTAARKTNNTRFQLGRMCRNYTSQCMNEQVAVVNINLYIAYNMLLW